MQVALVADVDADDVERLLLAVAVRAALANLLVRVDADQRPVHDLLVAQRLQRLVHAVRQRHVELDGVLLLAQVHLFQSNPENVPILEITANTICM